ncbi:hypothetical protein ACHAP3_006177 [Botrytis cinerea]
MSTRIEPGSGGCQGGSRDSVILDNDDDLDKARAGDQAEGASAPTESIDTPGTWYDVEEASYVEETTRDLGLMSSTAFLLLPYKPNPRPSILPATAKSDSPARCRQYYSKHVGGVCTPLPPPPSGDDEWTDEKMAESEKELGLALGEQQVESSLDGTPTSPSPRSVEAPQDEIRS